MMEITVCDREEIEHGIAVRTQYAVISIHDPDKRRAKVKRQSGLRDVLYLAFHDAEPSAGFELPADIALITSAQADEIRDFVRRHQSDADTIVVHCEQGMSRSPAVAAAISDALGLDPRRFWQMHTPNEYVYHMVADAFDRGNAGSGNQE